MLAVLSATENDFYAMPLPLVVFSWKKIGVECIVFIPKGDNPKLKLAKKYCGAFTRFVEFEAEEKRIPTFSQVSRLFGAAMNHENEDTVLITGDSDLAVFSDYYSQLNDGQIHVVGADLTSPDQYPICFIAMPVKTWRTVMGIDTIYQIHLEELINPIEGTNIRGEQWSYDQWYIKKKLDEIGLPIMKHNRAKEGTQFASRRADRDGWYFDPTDIIDAHLPRPLTDDTKFDLVFDLFKNKYPDDSFDWMKDYQEQYKKLL